MHSSSLLKLSLLLAAQITSVGGAAETAGAPTTPTTRATITASTPKRDRLDISSLPCSPCPNVDGGNHVRRRNPRSNPHYPIWTALVQRGKRYADPHTGAPWQHSWPLHRPERQDEVGPGLAVI